MKLSEEAKALRKAYQKNWREKNRNRVRDYNLRYWERRVEKIKESEGSEYETFQ